MALPFYSVTASFWHYIPYRLEMTGTDFKYDRSIYFYFLCFFSHLFLLSINPNKSAFPSYLKIIFLKIIFCYWQEIVGIYSDKTNCLFFLFFRSALHGHVFADRNIGRTGHAEEDRKLRSRRYILQVWRGSLFHLSSTRELFRKTETKKKLYISRD